MPRLDQPLRKVAAVIVRTVSNGQEKYRREPYNIVSIDYGDGSPVNTMLELVLGRPISPSERAEVYDDIRYYDAPPFSGVRIGYGSSGA